MTEFDFFKNRLSKIEPLLSLKQQQINSLLEITEAINHNMPIHALVRIYESVLIAQLGIHKIAMIIKESESNWNCISYAGIDPDFLKSDFNFLAKQYEGFKQIIKIESSVMGFEYIIPIFHKAEHIGLVLVANFDETATDSQEERLKFVQTISNIILVANENKRLFKKQLEQSLLEKDIALAAQIQNLLIPTSLIQNEFITADAYYKPHKNVGGDYYDLFALNEHEYLFCVSDISGKGVPAAILMANFQANLRAISKQFKDLKKVVQELNTSVFNITKGEKYITLFIAKFNTQTKILTYINAGHTPSFLLQENKLKELSTGCTIIGVFEDLPVIQLGEENILPNAFLVNYTDGLTEASNQDGVFFDTEGLSHFIQQNHSLEVKDFNAKLIETVNNFRGENELDDDLTLLSLRLQ